MNSIVIFTEYKFLRSFIDLPKIHEKYIKANFKNKKLRKNDPQKILRKVFLQWLQHEFFIVFLREDLANAQVY